jgi:hypothetical protein
MIKVTTEIVHLMQKLTEVTKGKVRVDIDEGFYTLDEQGRYLRFGFKHANKPGIKFVTEDQNIVEAREALKNWTMAVLAFNANEKCRAINDMYRLRDLIDERTTEWKFIDMTLLAHENGFSPYHLEAVVEYLNKKQGSKNAM